MEGRLLRVVPLAAAVILLGAALLTVGCGSSSGRFRYVQAATAVPTNVDLQVDGKSIQTAIGFGQTATYRTISSGTHKFVFFPAGTTINPYASASVSVGTYTTVFTTGAFSGSIPEVATFTDDNTTPTTGNSRLRILNMAPTFAPPAAGVDIYIVPTGNDISGLNPQISNLSYKVASNYQQLSANSYDVVVTVTGTQVILIRDSYTLTSEQVRTVVILDNANGGGPQQQIILNDLN
jgi:hypothetical protein